MNTEHIIEVKNLVKHYRREKRDTLCDISFSVKKGSLFVLLGPNGAGKTTAISILTTTLLPTSGRVVVAGFDIVKQAKDVREQIGIIFQRPGLDPNLTAEENIRFHVTLYGLYPFRPTFSLMPRNYKLAVQSLAKFLGLEESLFKQVKKLSGGMKRKLEILRSLLHNPQVLFLDEPTTGLDPASRRNFWDLLQQLRQKEGITVFLTTHYLDEAEQADTLCFLNRGQIVSHGTPEDVKQQLVEEYVFLNADNRDGLRNDLLQIGVEFTETPLFKIKLAKHQIPEVLKHIVTPLTHIETYTPSLEDVYLKIVKDQQAQ
jgi:ABC-2 type transport system ATP-binding protein